MVKMALEHEIEFFEKRRQEWLERHEGKYALIKGDELVGFFDSAETAFENGIDRWGNSPFLIRRVLREEPVQRMPALQYGLINAHS